MLAGVARNGESLSVSETHAPRRLADGENARQLVDGWGEGLAQAIVSCRLRLLVSWQATRDDGLPARRARFCDGAQGGLS